ncbi:MAG TPA: hypothetical protein VFM80_07860 [Gracilimonas sp.]|uniref:hypothetical protein n=1 Tax=Gracilimonas sp. TaxID=1974203 RepID=UPI002D98B4C6|nr:hypothetical protein [Gracilimonas sp.]
MKTLKHTLLIGLMTLLLSPLSFAQNFDANRMNRDIKIMESILNELFKIEAKSNTTNASSNSSFQVREVSGSGFVSASLFGARSNQVSGNYIPGYGIIFKIPYLLSRNISAVSVIKDSGEPSISFYYDSDDNSGDSQVTEETVITRITEFFKDYAPTIGQLKEDEQVTIVYGERKESAPQLRIFNRSGDSQENEEVKQIPVITVSAKTGDLIALKNGSLSSDNFESRLSISKESGEEKEQMDLEVMANILNTAFEEGDGDSFHLINSNSLSYTNINGFGVHYTLDMHSGHGLQSFTFGAITSFGEAGSDEAEESARKIKEAREKREDTVKAEYQNLVDQMKQYLVDYGRTLNSLTSDQFLIVTANITDHRDLVPAQVNFQLKKSTLEQLDRGQISRQEALNAVTITEY